MQPNSCFNCSHKAFKYIEMEMKAMLNMCFKVLDGFKKDNYPNQSKLTSLLKKRFWLQTALILKAEHKKKNTKYLRVREFNVTFAQASALLTREPTQLMRWSALMAQDGITVQLYPQRILASDSDHSRIHFKIGSQQSTTELIASPSLISLRISNVLKIKKWQL